MKCTRLYLYSLLFFLGAWLVVPAGRAMAFMPIVTNYTAGEYGAGLQNWALGQGSNGELYIGNNAGLLCFDGYAWSLSRMPSNQLVRSILVDGDRIYVGAYEEFGYFCRNAFGVLEYTSLWSRQGETETHNDEIWNILKVGGDIYFQSFSSWFKFDGTEVSMHYDPKHLPLYFHEAHGRIYVQMVNGDFYLLEKDSYRFLFSRRDIQDDAVVAVLPMAGGKMVLCTEWNGLFDYDGTRPVARPTQVDDRLKSNQVNRAVLQAADSMLVVGTIRGGIYAVDREGREQWHYDVNNGLCNNSVLRLFCDRNQHMWAALDTGVAFIRTGSPYSILVPDRSSQPLGMVYGVHAAGDSLYIATNQSAWLYSFGKRTIQPIQGTEGQNWYISAFDSQILLGNNFGTKTIVGTVARDIPGTGSGSTCLRKCVVNGQEVLIESSYYDLRLYRKEPGGTWVFSHVLEGFRQPIRQFEIDHSGTIWAAHMSLGLYQIELSKDLRRVEKSTYFKSLPDGGTASASLMHVMKIRGRVVLSDNRRAYTYDDMDRRIVSFAGLDSLYTQGVNTATPVDGHVFWLASSRGYTQVRYAEGAFGTERFVPSSFFGLECNESSNHVYMDGHTAYFCLNNGVGRIDLNHRSVQSETRPPALLIRGVSALSSDFRQRPLPVETGEQLPEIWGDISFRLSYPNMAGEPLRFCYRLEGGGLLLESEAATPSVTYGSLAYGTYRFVASVQGADGQTLGQVEYEFCKPRPFYLSFYAWVCYVLLAGGVLYLYSRWHAAKMLRRRNREVEQEKREQEYKMLEQEHIIAQQRKQLLEAELQVKSKELASLALDAVAQRKAMDSLKEAMLEQEHKGTLQHHDVETMLKQLDGTLNEEEFWDIYQANFDMIHKNFFRNLRKQYPSLTAGDLRFCALLRLNLSTKDIAQFSNLTIRGVETARYRIRKKLAIPGHVNLTDFLIDFA